MNLKSEFGKWQARLESNVPDCKKQGRVLSPHVPSQQFIRENRVRMRVDRSVPLNVFYHCPATGTLGTIRDAPGPFRSDRITMDAIVDALSFRTGLGAAKVDPGVSCPCTIEHACLITVRVMPAIHIAAAGSIQLRQHHRRSGACAIMG